MKRQSKLESDRLLLREFTLDDAEDMYLNWASDKEVTKYLTWSVHTSIEITKEIVKHWVDAYQDEKTIRFAIVLKESNELIGGIDVVGYENNTPVIGYCLSRKHWNKGYMSEACKVFTKYLFMLGYKKIKIEAAVDNIASNRVIQKCGFKLIGKRHCNKTDMKINTYELIHDSIILETKRLILREMNDNDFGALKKVISDPETMKYYPKPYDDNGVRRWINWCEASYIRRGFGLYSVIIKETGEMIGDCGVSMQIIDDELKPEIGYHLRKDYHRQGLGKEMTQAMRDYFFNHFNYDEVYSYMDKDNVPSMKTAEANGMKYLHIYKTHGGEECRVYRIKRSEWEDIKRDKK